MSQKGLQQAVVVQRSCDARQECDSSHRGDCEETRDDHEDHRGDGSGDKDGGGDTLKIVGMVVMSWQGYTL